MWRLFWPPRSGVYHTHSQTRHLRCRCFVFFAFLAEAALLLHPFPCEARSMTSKTSYSRRHSLQLIQFCSKSLRSLCASDISSADFWTQSRKPERHQVPVQVTLIRTPPCRLPPGQLVVLLVAALYCGNKYSSLPTASTLCRFNIFQYIFLVCFFGMIIAYLVQVSS